MLIINTKCGHSYTHSQVSNVRAAKRELRWTNANGDARSMAWAFIDSAYHNQILLTPIL